MKSQKINDAQWRITTPNGNYVNLDYYAGQWHVTIHRSCGPDQYIGSHEKRFDAKVEAEKLLGETV